MENQPAAPAPPGYVVHMNDPQTSALGLGVAIGIIAIAISTLLLLLRLYTRVVFTKSSGIDDVFISLTWACATVFQAMVIYLRLTKQIGVHVWETTVARANTGLLYMEINTVLFIALMMFAKVALCLFYRRLSEARWFQISNWATIGSTVAYSIAFILAFIFSCDPIGKSWDITEGHCIDKGVLYLAHTSLNVATDLATLVLPIPVVVRLTLPALQKLGAVLMFVIGSLTLVTSCVRLALLMPMLGTQDVTWAVSSPTILISIEAGLVIVCICFPSLRLFLRRVAPSTIPHGSAKPRLQEAEDVMEMGYQPKNRPFSELTLWKGRQSQRDSWQRMPEPAVPSSPAKRKSLESFHFEFSLEGASVTNATSRLPEETLADEFRIMTFDLRSDAGDSITPKRLV